MNVESHTVNQQPNRGPVQDKAMDFAQIPATLITHKSEPWLRITARGKHAKTSCAIIPLTTYSRTPEGTKSSLFLASFHSEHGNHIRAVALCDEIAYPRQLLRLLRLVFNHPDTQHIVGLRPGHWKRIRVEHPVHVNDSMPGFRFTLTIKRTRLKTRIERTDTEDVQNLPFSLDCLNSPLGDMLAGILREHYTTDDLPDCPVDWGLI